MKKLIGVLLVAAAATAAQGQVAQRTQFSVELSLDGSSWSHQLDLPTIFSGRAFGRVTVSYVNNGTADPLFFNGGRFQPTIAGWNTSSDTVLPFNATGRVVADFGATPVLGRVFGATTVSAITAHQYNFAGTSYLRFAETAATNHPGQGSGTNNVTGGAGINCSNNTLSPQPGIVNLPLFVWGMNIDNPQAGPRTMSFTIPQEAFRTSGATANPPNTRSATWVTSTSPFTAVEAPTLDTIGATMTFTPAPGAFALLGMGGLVVGRRRR
ncbi:MAG: hypothetical protein ACOYN0_19020 [Phycisphaerales bacterium]